jgi:hypothetical protein
MEKGSTVFSSLFQPQTLKSANTANNSVAMEQCLEIRHTINNACGELLANVVSI